MQCPKCKAFIDGSLKNCPNCNTQLIDNDQADSSSTSLISTVFSSFSKKGIIMSLIALIISFGGIGYYIWTCSPQYSIKTIQQSIVNHDVATFQKYVDVDNIATKAVDKIMNSKKVNKDKPKDAFSQGIEESVKNWIKPQLTAAFKSQILNIVKAKPDTKSDVASESSIPDNKAKSNFKEISNVNKLGKEATVSLTFVDKDQKDFIVDLTMKDMGGYWRVSEIANIDQILDGK